MFLIKFSCDLWHQNWHFSFLLLREIEFLFPSVSWSMKLKWCTFLCLTGIKNQFVLMPLKQKVLGKCKADCKMPCFFPSYFVSHTYLAHSWRRLCKHLCETLWLCLFNTFPGLGWKNDLWIGLGFTHWNVFGRWQHMRSFYAVLITIKSFTDTSLASQDRAYLTQYKGNY